MTAHGHIKVNADIVAYWQAQRMNPVILRTEPQSYEFTIMEGNLRWSGTVEHTYNDGITVLASKVLAQRPHDWPVPIQAPLEMST